MSVGTLYIVNKSGGVIFARDVSPVPRLPANEYLRLGSTFASLHTIAKQLAPVAGAGGIQVVEAAAFSLHCLETPTGLKFFCTAVPRAGGGAGAGAGAARPSAQAVAAFLREAYRLYADYALKSPFYEVDMPIRARLFDHYLDKYVVDAGLGTGGAAVAAGAAAGGGR